MSAFITEADLLEMDTTVRPEEMIHTHHTVAAGVFIDDYLTDLSLSQREAAAKMKISPISLSRIIAGKQSITVPTALKLETLTGLGADVWLTLDMNHRLAEARKRVKPPRKARVSA